MRDHVLGEVTRRDFAPRQMRPQSSVGLGETIYKPKNVEKATFYSPIEIKATPALISKSPEEREIVVDSGAPMHMLSKRDLSSDELETLRRSRAPTTVVTAMETCKQTRKHKYTFTLLASSRLCNYSKIRLQFYRLESSAKNTDTSYEWVSGQKPCLTEQGKKIICKTYNFVPLDVPGLSSSSGTSSSSTSTSRDLSSSGPAAERRDDPASGNWSETNPKTQNQIRDNNRDSDDRLRDLFEWRSSQINPEDTEVHAPVHISQDSGSERPAKVASKSRKSTVLKLTFQKTEIAKIACGPK